MHFVIDLMCGCLLSGGMDPLMKCFFYGEEARSSSRYFWNNRGREAVEGGVCVIQRTITGEAFYRDTREHVRVGRGEAMLFSHGEDSCYGYPRDATEPYRLGFLALSGVADLFAAIREKAGSRIALSARSEALSAFQSVVHHYRQRSFRDRFHESQCIYELLLALLRQAWQGDLTRDPVAAAHDHIQAHFSEPLSQKEVAERVGLSREHLTRMFKRRYGITPGHLCHTLRMQKARELLELQFGQVSEVAACCGYTDANSFARAFKNTTGISPQQYLRA